MGARKWSECIDRDNKVAIFMHPSLCDAVSKWHQVYSGGAFTVKAPSTQARPHSKFEEDSFGHSQGMSNQTFNFFIFLSRHMVMCRAAQDKGAHANGVSILTGTTKSQFHVSSSVMSSPNGTKFTVEIASMQERPHSKFD